MGKGHGKEVESLPMLIPQGGGKHRDPSHTYFFGKRQLGLDDRIIDLKIVQQ